MLQPLPPPADFDAIGVAKRLLRVIRAGALATLEHETGSPFASLVTVATDLDGAPVLLLSRLSAHTRNLEVDARASLLLVQGGKGDPLAHPRLTVTGRLTPSAEPQLRSRFLARHPKAELYAGFADFCFWRMEIERAHLNGGFARATTLTVGEIRTDPIGAEALAAGAALALAHLNAVKRDTLSLCATRLAGERAGDWRATGVDPDGLDIAAGERTARLVFPRRVVDEAGLQAILEALADEARGRG